MTTRTTIQILARCCGAALAATALAASLAASAQSPPRTPVAAERAAEPAFERAAQQDLFRRVVDDFIAAAAASDMARAASMISPAIAAKTGREGVEGYLGGHVLPFFAQFKEIGRSETVAGTAEVEGFAFYLYMVSKTDELRPFVINVIEEGGAKVVANVLVDHFVESRHCARVAGGWKCPDFR
jgi:hypothetical protein